MTKCNQSLDDIFEILLAAINTFDTREENDYLVFEDFDKEDGARLYDKLYEPEYNLERRRFTYTYNAVTRKITVTTPSIVHQCAYSWLINQYSTWVRKLLLPDGLLDTMWLAASPLFHNFTDAYASSLKEPDGVIRYSENEYPSIILECGWSETAAQLEEAARVWDIGMGGNVKAIIVVKFYKIEVERETRVAGFVDVITRCANQREETRKIIFPVPNPPELDPFLRLGDIYGSPGRFPEGADPLVQLPLSMEMLRKYAAMSLEDM